MWPTTLGFFFGMLTSFGVLCVIPDFEGFNMMERVKWALTAGVLIAYGVTYALPVADRHAMGFAALYPSYRTIVLLGVALQLILRISSRFGPTSLRRGRLDPI